MSSEELTALREAAVQMHELFTELVAAGFTENQAISLMAQWHAAMRPEDDQ